MSHAYYFNITTSDFLKLQLKLMLLYFHFKYIRPSFVINNFVYSKKEFFK